MDSAVVFCIVLQLSMMANINMHVSICFFNILLPKQFRPIRRIPSTSRPGPEDRMGEQED